MFEQDYIMRQIKQIIEVVMKIIFKIDTVRPETMTIQDHDKQARSDELILKIDNNNIRDAIEDFKSAANEKNKDDFLIGINFFTRICALDEDVLNENNITYSQIQEEMRTFFAQYGISDQLFDLIFMK